MPIDDAENYRSAFENIGIPALITDTDYIITDVNQAGLEFVGYDYDEITGQHVATITSDESVLGSLIESVSAGDSWEGDFEVTTKDGQTVFGKGSAAPMLQDGEIVGFVAIFIDTTKQRQYRNAAEVLNRLLRHDLKNQLNVVYGSIQLAESAAEVEAVSEHLGTAIAELTSLINKSERARDLRELLEITYDQPNEPLRLDFVLNDVIVEMVGTHENADFQFDRFPAVHVYGDHLLEDVLSSILDNAVVHNDQEQPVVEIDVAVGDETVVVAVADNGPGIPESQRDMVLGREEIDDLHHGTGVSLYFADNVIKSYAGDLWIEDNDPQGAVFNVELPKAE